MKNIKSSDNSWDLAGEKYDTISRHISDAIDHCIIRLDARSNDKVLDVATGTGWTARQIAESGIDVTGVDFALELLKAANLLSRNEKVNCSFKLGNALFRLTNRVRLVLNYTLGLHDF